MGIINSAMPLSLLYPSFAGVEGNACRHDAIHRFPAAIYLLRPHPKIRDLHLVSTDKMPANLSSIII